MALRGDTSNLLLADIFQTLTQNGQTGLLSLRSGAGTRQVLFAKNGITLADAAVFRAPRLGHLFVAGGVAPRDQIDAALSDIDRAGPDAYSSVALIRLLAERELVDPERAEQILSSEVREELFELFALPRMEFEFNEDETPHEGVPDRCLFRTEEIILEAARRLDELELVRTGISPADEFYVLVDPDDTGDAAPEIVERLDARHTLIDISEALLRPRFEVARVVFRLLKAGKVRTADADELISAARELDPTQHRARIARLLAKARAQMGPDDRRLDQIADLYKKSGNKGGAIAALLDRARTLLAAGNTETAYTLAMRARDLDPGHLDVLRTLVDLHEARGEKDDQIQVLTSLSERAASVEDYDHAVEYAARLARLFPDSPLLDRAFPMYCHKTEKQRFGAQILSEAATRRAVARRTVLFEGILLLDPGRSDVKKELLKLRKKRQRKSLHVTILVAAMVPLLAWGGWRFLARFGQQRLRGRFDAISTLLDKGQAQLAANELKDMLTEISDGDLRDEAEHLLTTAEARIENENEKRVAEARQAALDRLPSIQDKIDQGKFAEALIALRGLSDEHTDAEMTKAFNTKRIALERRLEVEADTLVKLSQSIQIPETDSDLVAAKSRYVLPFSDARNDAFRKLAEVLRSPRKNEIEMARFCTAINAAMVRARPAVAEIEARLERNGELTKLSGDYERILDAERRGDFASAAEGYTQLLRSYGQGALTQYFTNKQHAAEAARDAAAQARVRYDAGDFAGMRRVIDEAAAALGDVDMFATVGRPLALRTMPAGATVKSDGHALGATPLLVWVKGDQPMPITVEAPGYHLMETDLAPTSGPEVTLELPRESRFDVTLPARSESGAVVTSTEILVGARDGVLYRLDRKTGTRTGQVQLDSIGGAATAPIVVGDMVVLLLAEGAVAGVSRQPFAKRFAVPLGALPAGGAVVIDGSLWVATVDGKLHQLDVRTGQDRVVATLDGVPSCAPAIIGSIIAVGDTQGRVTGFAREDGAPKFQTKVHGQPVIGVVATDGLFIAADDGGRVFAIDASGAARWEQRVDSAVAAPPTAGDGLVVVAAGKTAYVFDAHDGEQRVAATAPDWITAPPVLTGGRLYAADHAGGLNAFDGSSGQPQFRHHLKGLMKTAPLVLPEGVLLVTDQGQVTLVGA